MINKIKISNFKLHDKTDLQLNGLTILSGMNGMGKSSVIQALLLLRQSYLTGDLISRGLNLKGTLTKVGSADDLVCQQSLEDTLKIDLTSDNDTLDFEFLYPEINKYETFLPAVSEATDLDLTVPQINAKDRCLSIEKEQKLLANSLFTNNFQYLSAFRLGPQESYQRDSSLVQHQQQLSSKMGICDLTAHYLNHFGSKQISIKELALPGDESNVSYALIDQVELWMQRIAPLIKIEVEQLQERFRLNYRWGRMGERDTEKISALNTGFGITYVLPLLVSLLDANKDSLIMIENPEAHIHPKAQAVLMELVALAVKSGVQIVLETHSDHIINGALVAIKENSLKVDDTSIYFFTRDDKKHVAVAEKLAIRSNGSIINAPDDFFDQIDIDLKKLVGF